MAIDPTRFCINRKIAPNLSLDAFFKLVQRLGLNKVELRNDMRGGKVTDNLSHAEVKSLVTKYGLEIVTINAVYPFNQISAELLEKAEGLLKDAQGVGAKALVLCPLNDGTPVSDNETMAALKQLAPLFAQYGIQGLVEPLGFPVSSLRSAVQAQTLIRDSQLPFKIVLDTFHHHLYEKAEQEFEAGIDINAIGLVHLSGVEDSRPTAELTDEERIMLTSDDLLNSASQVQRLERMGYKGVYAFEPFSSELDRWSEADIEHEIRQSIALLQG
ncbi:TIM barrel protein [Erwiniaceae bacterium BAC15a-03b]|uniref:TIM barrel protein n=1 Tax=Winslowiella arboricola TaxID=2978220 RepID=A0A9J6PJM5_9GAMM|nr:TIM barrel protein [Winslowiella arboricola]MCU5771767.1 TIM barrel protein [Winslowiella arboricola]MCU5777562.1 TIM barrel protein [Winslowiella arboricola]